MRFNEDFIRRVIEANNLVEIISHYTQLKPSGGGLMGRCPFPDHKERTPSFSVSETKQVYHCFGCHKSGNVISFLRDYHGYAFPEAVEWLAHRASIPLPARQAEATDNREGEKRKLIMEANKLAARYFTQQLLNTNENDPVRKYIEKRQLAPEILDLFRIGYATRDWDGMVSYLTSHGVSTAIAEEARLIVARKEGRSGHFDLFRDRLMFPIMNTMGEPVAFGGRVLNPADNPKYLNSPETPVFEKKKVLYGLHQTARYIRSEDAVVIVEGYMDAVSLYQHGIRNVAAVMSSSLTPEQARLIKRMTRNVIMLLDGDSAGMDGAERSLPILLQADLYPKGIFLSEGMDPDDFVRSKGPEALQDLIAQAKDLLFVVLNEWMIGYKGEPAEKLKLTDKLRPVLEKIPDARLRELYVQEGARRLGVQPDWLRKAVLSEAYRGGAANPSMPISVSHSKGEKAPEPRREPLTGGAGATIKISDASKAELMALALTIKSRANFEVFLKESSIEDFVHEGLQSILTEASYLYGQDPQRFDRLISLLLTSVDQPGLLMAAENLPSSDKGGSESAEDGELDRKLLRDSLRRVKEHRLRRDLKVLQQELLKDPAPEKMAELTRLQERISHHLKN